MEKYTFFEDINKQNYKTMLSSKDADLKYSILPNEIKENFIIDEKQISSYKRNLKINDIVIKESDIDGSTLLCKFSNYYESMNTKDKINDFFKKLTFSFKPCSLVWIKNYFVSYIIFRLIYFTYLNLTCSY